ncbi:hypothetical protein JHK86_001591 [Glycine max]|nr:hypothetical protein JHK86_001591 [Glycine max]
MIHAPIGGSLQEGLQDAALVGNTNGFKVNVNSALQTSSSQRKLLSDESNHYALCGLKWGFNRSERPVVGVGICISIAIAAPALAGVNCIASPIGKDFCVVGRNLEKLHFGNKYVHIATFLLFCVAPFWILNTVTINIDNEPVRVVLGLLGMLLCVFGLLYGGYWRIQMRGKFNLPPNKLCCGKPAVTDCIQWLLCCWCSLAQEVRTAEYYDIVDDKFFCQKLTQSCVKPALNSLPPEDKAPQVTSKSTSFWSSHTVNKIWSQESNDYSSLSEIEFSRERKQNVMEAPILQTIQVDDNDIKRT